jgi:hypothetical protein
MKSLNDYLDICKIKKELKNDAELSRFLGITRASLSIIRSGGGVSQETAEKLSEGSGESLDDIWIASLIQKEQNPKFKKILEKVSHIMGRAAVIIIAINIYGYYSKTYASEGYSNDLSVIYIMRSL